jgi:vitamin B12 transporter
MNKTILASTIGLLFTTGAYAEATSIYTDEVVVTASRIAESRENVLADVSVITREEIERAGQSTLAELLSTQPGIQIESNGGLGATTNIHLRGTGSQAVVVMIDGMRVSSATTGTTTLSQILPEQIERIEILRGPASSLYGADAIGGVIQIFTRQGKGEPRLSASAGYGSNNTQQASAALSGSVGDTRYAASVASLTTDGISSFRTQSGRDQDHDGFRNLSFNGNISQTLAEGHEIGAQVYTSNGHYDFDGNDFPANQDLRQQSFALTSKNKITEYWQSQFRIGESQDDLYSVGSFGVSSLRTKQRQHYWQNDLRLPLGTLTLAYDRLEDKVDGNGSYTVDKRFNNGYLASYLLEKNAHAFKFGLRRDNNSQFGEHTTGNIGYGYRLNDYWRVNGSFGTAFRAPTFNDLYLPFQDYGFGYTYQGNPNLKPETSRNTEAAVVYDQGHHRISLTAYHNEIDNLLVGTNGTLTDFPSNVGSAKIKGATLSYEGWIENYHLRASADVQDPRNEDTGKVIARRARQYGSLWLGQVWGKFEIGTEVIASGKRFNDPENQIVMAGYTLVNLTGKYKINEDWSLNARLNNLLDKDYTLVTTATTFTPTAPPYGTPGTNLFISVRYSPSK